MEILVMGAMALVVIALGWWGRIEVPIIASAVVGGLINLTIAELITMHEALGMAAVGAVFAYLRKPVVIEEYRKRGKLWRSDW